MCIKTVAPCAGTHNPDKFAAQQFQIKQNAAAARPGRHFHAERMIYTTAPSVSSFSLTGLIRSSRLTPSHIATAAATNTDE